MILQVIMNGVLAGLTWGLLAVGFTLIYRVVRFFHVAYAATYLIGAYVGVWLIQEHTAGVGLAGVAAMAVAAIAGCIMELVVYLPLRKRRSSPLVFLMASLALVVIVQNIVGLLFGSEIQVVGIWESQDSIQIAGASITQWQAISAFVSILLSIFAWFVVRHTSFGREMRAVAADEALADIVGIRSNRIILITIGLGSALAGIAGFLAACDTAIAPSNGLGVLLIGVTAAIIGGIGSVRGAMLGGLLVGFAQHLGVWKLPAQWQDTIVFLILIIFLLVKPEGLFGSPLRTAKL
jgi:branched-chain amino acid transport system permease protein